MLNHKKIEFLKARIKILEDKEEELWKLEQLVDHFLVLSNLETSPFSNYLMGLGPARRINFEAHIESLEKTALDKAERKRIEAIIRSYLQRTGPSRNV